MKRVLFVVVAAMSVIAPCRLAAQRASRKRHWKSLRVLWIAAHPDDEDTQPLTWLSRSGRADAAYLSLTRGDGGQNLIGNELGEPLGVIRTEELLAARRVDGAHQYFTRAYDFGFSKTAAETYTHWPKDSLLADVVTVVRAFRPHIIMTTFSGLPRTGTGSIRYRRSWRRKHTIRGCRYRPLPDSQVWCCHGHRSSSIVSPGSTRRERHFA